MANNLDMSLDDLIKINKSSSTRGAANVRGRSAAGPSRRFTNRAANRPTPYSPPMEKAPDAFWQHDMFGNQGGGRAGGGRASSIETETKLNICNLDYGVTNDDVKKWRQDFRVPDLSEDTVRKAALTGKAFVHDYSDVNDRPVLVVVASKHFPSLHDPLEDEKLCVFLVEKALRMLPEGKEDILVIIDLRRFGTENADIKFITFLFDVFYSYYPRRLSQVLFVEAPFVFKPIWQLTKPLLKSYASLRTATSDHPVFSIHNSTMAGLMGVLDLDISTLKPDYDQVRFCSVKTVQEDYFTKETLPASFKHSSLPINWLYKYAFET